MVPREVAFGKVHGGVRLIIEAVVDLRGVAKVSAVLAVDHPIESPVVAPFKERAGNGRRGLVCETVRLCECEFIQRGRVYGLSLVFTLPLNGSEAEKFVLEREREHQAQTVDATSLNELTLAKAHGFADRSEEHTSELQSPDTISYAVFC